MDPALIALASAGGTTLVQAMATDAWSAVRGTVARILGLGDGNREAALLQRLEASRTAVLAAEGPAGDAALTAEAARWSGRFEALLDEHPEFRAEVDALVDRLEGARGGPRPAMKVTQRISALGDAYVAGRDQFIDRRPRDGRA